MDKQDFRSELTEKIIAELERGVIPWEQPWFGGVADQKNGSTGAAYRGGNAVHLAWTAASKGFEPVWLTFRQAKALGGHVRQGEKGTQVEVWKTWTPTDNNNNNNKDSNSDTSDTTKSKERLFAKTYTVFSISQIENLDHSKLKIEQKTQKTEFSAVQDAETILSRSGAVIRHGGDRAF